MARVTKYGSYRGRNNGGKFLLALFLVAVIVACAVYLVLEGDFQLPEFSFEQTIEAPQVEEPEDLDITISPVEPEASTQEPTFVTHGLWLSTEGNTWADTDLSAYNTVVIPMKDVDGKVHFPSQVGSESGFVAENESALPALLSQDIHAVAAMSALLDSPYALHHVEDAGLKNTGGYLFYDGYGKNWLDPGKEGAQAYTIALARELIALGFDEIVLTNLTYPAYGKIEKTAPTADPKAAGLTQFVKALHQALDGTDVTLSIQVPSESLVSGTVPYEELVPYLSRLFVEPADSNTMDAILSQDTELVVMTTAPTPEGGYLILPSGDA